MSSGYTGSGWRHTIELREGVAMTNDWYVAHDRTQSPRATSADSIVGAQRRA